MDRLVGHHVVRLLGGDGQSVRADGEVVPQQVRVVVEDGVGPLAGVAVSARAGDDTAPGLVGPAADGEPAPGSVAGTPGAVVDVATDENGVARFWWQRRRSPAGRRRCSSCRSARRTSPRCG